MIYNDRPNHLPHNEEKLAFTVAKPLCCELIKCELNEQSAKIVVVLIYGVGKDYFTLTNLIHSSGTQGRTYKLLPRCNRIDIYKFFSQHTIDIWNSLLVKPNNFSSLGPFILLLEAQIYQNFYSPGINPIVFLSCF